MRKGGLVAAAFCFGTFISIAARADTATRDQLRRYFAEWFSVCPDSRVTVAEDRELSIPGFEAYQIERHCKLKNREEQSVALLDPARREVFVGQVLHSDERRDQPFSAATDFPVLAEALRGMFGTPVSLELGSGSRGTLLPIRVAVRQSADATATMPGFVSQDGASLLLGEFFPLDERPDALRERLLSESPGVRPPKGSFAVTAFIDFQCEKCRVRTPKVRDFVWTHGGALEIRFLPLVKVHNWAFAAAEQAAALADVSPALYAKYEDALFPRAGAMNEKAARELAADIADAAGVRPAFEAELSSGRARQRVIRDIELALRLGLNGTPVFFYRGAELTPEPEVVEAYLQQKLTNASAATGKGSTP
jgi:protein-disulfide isomerase